MPDEPQNGKSGEVREGRRSLSKRSLVSTDPESLPHQELLHIFKYYMRFEQIKMSQECQERLLSSIRNANHTEYQKSKPRTVRRQLLALSDSQVFRARDQELVHPVRGTVCPMPLWCDFCKLVVAVARLLPGTEISHVSAAFGGSWGHSKVYQGNLPFGDDCCRTGHRGQVQKPEPIYRFKKAKTAPEKASKTVTFQEPEVELPSYQPMSPVETQDGEVLFKVSDPAPARVAPPKVEDDAAVEEDTAECECDSSAKQSLLEANSPKEDDADVIRDSETGEPEMPPSSDEWHPAKEEYVVQEFVPQQPRIILRAARSLSAEEIKQRADASQKPEGPPRSTFGFNTIVDPDFY